MNTKKQGDRGLGIAIAHFTKLGHTVMIPLTDSQDYDLVVDDGKALQKIQVKYTEYKCKTKEPYYEVSCSIKGGSKGGIVRRGQDLVFDYLFVATDTDCWFIPKDQFTNGVRLGPKFDGFKQ